MIGIKLLVGGRDALHHLQPRSLSQRIAPLSGLFSLKLSVICFGANLCDGSVVSNGEGFSCDEACYKCSFSWTGIVYYLSILPSNFNSNRFSKLLLVANYWLDID
ncbi:hypothetical protein AAHE18_07G189700 [Arachis hypogaea]